MCYSVDIMVLTSLSLYCNVVSSLHQLFFSSDDLLSKPVLTDRQRHPVPPGGGLSPKSPIPAQSNAELPVPDAAFGRPSGEIADKA